jgi:hypothetical protein
MDEDGRAAVALPPTICASFFGIDVVSARDLAKIARLEAATAPRATASPARARGRPRRRPPAFPPPPLATPAVSPLLTVGSGSDVRAFVTRGLLRTLAPTGSPPAPAPAPASPPTTPVRRTPAPTDSSGDMRAFVTRSLLQRLAHGPLSPPATPRRPRYLDDDDAEAETDDDNQDESGNDDEEEDEDEEESTSAGDRTTLRGRVGTKRRRRGRPPKDGLSPAERRRAVREAAAARQAAVDGQSDDMTSACLWICATPSLTGVEVGVGMESPQRRHGTGAMRATTASNRCATAAGTARHPPRLTRPTTAGPARVMGACVRVTHCHSHLC